MVPFGQTLIKLETLRLGAVRMLRTHLHSLLRRICYRVTLPPNSLRDAAFRPAPIAGLKQIVRE